MRAGWATGNRGSTLSRRGDRARSRRSLRVAAIVSFLFDPTLDATTWRAEQALRPAVITRKTCGGGNRTARGAASQQILTSVLRTTDQRGLDPTTVLVTLLTAPTPTVPSALQTPLALH